MAACSDTRLGNRSLFLSSVCASIAQRTGLYQCTASFAALSHFIVQGEVPTGAKPYYKLPVFNYHKVWLFRQTPPNACRLPAECCRGCHDCALWSRHHGALGVVTDANTHFKAWKGRVG